MQKQGKSLNTKRAQNYEDDENDFEEFNQRPQKKIKNENKEIKKKFDKREDSKKSGKAGKAGKFDKSEKKEKKEKGGDVVRFQKLNKLYNDLMAKKEKTDKVKKGVVDEILKIASGVLVQISRKHDGSRVVQGCLTYGTPEQREQIIAAFLNNEMVELAKSKYGHFVLIKMASFLNQKQLDHGLEILMKHIDFILTLNEGAKTIEAFVKAGSKKSILENSMNQITNIKVEDATTHERLENAALKMAEKKAYASPLQQQIIAESLRILIPDERAKILNMIITDFANFFFTKEGVNLVCNAIDYMEPKDKKLLLKNFKSNIKNYLTAEKTLCHIVIIKLLSSVDDTVLLKKTILNEITKDLEELLQVPHVNEIFLSFYDNEEDYLSKYVTKQSKEVTTKKDEETRKAELVEYTLDSLVNVFSFQLGDYIASSKLSKLLYLVMKNILDNNRENSFELITTAVDTIIDNYNKSDKAKDLEHNVLISHPNGHRLVKSLISGYQKYSGEAKQFYDELIEKIFEFAIKELSILLQTKAIFVIIALIENTDYKDQLVQEINSNKHLLKNLKGAGVEILKKLL